MTTTVKPLTKAVLVHAPEFDVSCAARLRVAHDQTNNRGSISIRFTADLAAGSRILMLNIRPDTVDKCAVHLRSNAKLIPSRMLSTVPAPVISASAVSTMTLCLNTAGVVLVPSGITTLTPANGSDANFHAFSKICQTTILHLHFSRQQFVQDELSHLQMFSRALGADSLLQAEHIDYARLNAGRGMEEKDWRVFDKSFGPPPYNVVSGDCVLGKRSRGTTSVLRMLLLAYWYVESSSNLSHDVTPKVFVPPCSPPPWSPTEADTTSASPPSPRQIRPTKFTKPTRATTPDQEDIRVLRIRRTLNGIPDHIIREALIRSGRKHLLAPPEDLDLDSSSDSEQVTVAKVDKIIERRLDQFVEQRLGSLTRDAFESLTERRLQGLVESQLPGATKLFLNDAVREYRDQFYEDCKMSEAELREEVEEGATEVRNAAAECLQEIKEQAQRSLDDMEDQSNKLVVSVDEEIVKLKPWLATLAGSFVNKKRSADPVLGVTVRGSSV